MTSSIFDQMFRSLTYLYFYRPSSVSKKAKEPKIQDSPPNERMTSILNTLIGLFKVAISQAFPAIVDPPCPVSISTKGGDYQFNGALPIVGLLKVI